MNNKCNKVLFIHARVTLEYFNFKKGEWILKVCYLFLAMSDAEQLQQETIKHRNESDPYLNEHIWIITIERSFKGLLNLWAHYYK